MKRRDFLKLAGIVAASVTAKALKADVRPDNANKKQFVSVLQDTTLCIGCRSCEEACGRTYGLHVPDSENDKALEKVRRTSERQRTVVNRYKTSKGDVYVKIQCMHCWQPACTTGCLTEAMYKTKTGPIIWREKHCLGCRLCMLSCPFYIPKFEYSKVVPNIIKCTMCHERIKKGKLPACVESCPTGALRFGLKRDIMEIARTRIYNHRDKYIPQIYGEHVVGGTGWLYLSAVPFKEIGFREDLGTLPLPEHTKEFLYAVPGILLTMPPLLYGLCLLTQGDIHKEKE